MTENEMYQYGVECGRTDKAAGEFSEPIPAEDGADYTRGYLEGWAA